MTFWSYIWNSADALEIGVIWSNPLGMKKEHQQELRLDNEFT